MELFENIEKIFPALKSKNVKIAVVSGNYKPFIEKILENHMLLGFVDCVVGGHPKIKPDPASLLEGMKQLSVKPEETIVVGDMIGDIKAGKNAGSAKIIVTTYGWTSKEVLKKHNPDVIVDSPKELLKALNSI